MNATERFRLRFQTLLARGLAASEIAERVRLAAASEVWAAGAPRERAAWYLWLRDVPGAWQVELAGAERLPALASAIVGRFTVRHYPSPAGGAFASFSAEERRAVAEILDATGTPRIELASAIPDTLFTVGGIEWALDLEGDAAAFGLASLDRLRTRTGGGEVLRDVPGWELTAPVFSLLVGLHAQVERRAASRLVVSRQPGFEQVVSERLTEHRDAPDTVQADALVLFPHGHASGEATRLLEALRDPVGDVVVDASFAPGARPPDALLPDPRLPLAVSQAWFGGAEHAEDRIACAC